MWELNWLTGHPGGIGELVHTSGVRSIVSMRFKKNSEIFLDMSNKVNETCILDINFWEIWQNGSSRTSQCSLVLLYVQHFFSNKEKLDRVYLADNWIISLAGAYGKWKRVVGRCHFEKIAKKITCIPDYNSEKFKTGEWK